MIFAPRLKRFIIKAKACPNLLKGRLSEFNEFGYIAVENFLSSEECGELIREVEEKLESHSTSVWCDEHRSDNRLYGIDSVSDKISKLFRKQELVDLFSWYYGRNDYSAFTLGAKLIPHKNNLGSGGGWHRDSVACQLKVIIYLTDVSRESGPFELIPKSHKLKSFLCNLFFYRIWLMKNRFDNDEISLITNEKAITTVEGKKGSLLIVDTSSIHRGRPIVAGERLALTHYAWAKDIPAHVKKLLVCPELTEVE